MTRNTKNPGAIIAAEAAHVSTMVDIFCHGQNTHHDLFPEIFFKAEDHEKIARYLKGYLKPRNPLRTRRNFSLVWQVDDAVAGFVLYQFYASSNVFFGDNRWMCFVDDIAIDPNFRSQGGASKLLASVVEKADEVGNCVFHAQVWRGNTASEALFQKFGFEDNAKNFYRLSK